MVSGGFNCSAGGLLNRSDVGFLKTSEKLQRATRERIATSAMRCRFGRLLCFRLQATRGVLQFGSRLRAVDVGQGQHGVPERESPPLAIAPALLAQLDEAGSKAL